MFHLHYKQVLTIHTPVQVLVIVKKSSPKNLSADCRSTVGRQVAYISGKTCRPSVGQQTTNCQLTVGRQLTNSRPTGFLGALLHNYPSVLSQTNKFKALSQTSQPHPRTPLSISSQIFPQVEIHLFCRANIETCLHTVLYLSTAVLNNCCKINQIFIALGEFDAIKSSSSLNFLSHSLKKSMSI